MTLGEHLKRARTRADLTQREVGKRTGINYKTISNWENNVSNPAPADLKALADVFHVSTDELLGRDTFKPNLFGNDENSAMMKHIKENKPDGTIKSFLRLSPEAREQAQSYIDYLVKKDAKARVKSGSVQAGRNFAG